MTVPVRTGPPISVGIAQQLFALKPSASLLEVSRDGRFLLLVPQMRAAERPIIVDTAIISSAAAMNGRHASRTKHPATAQSEDVTAIRRQLNGFTQARSPPARRARFGWCQVQERSGRRAGARASESGGLSAPSHPRVNGDREISPDELAGSSCRAGSRRSSSVEAKLDPDMHGAGRGPCALLSRIPNRLG